MSLRALKRIVRGESIAGLLIATMALVISGISMYQSVRANRAVAIANKLAARNIKISEDALSFSKRIEESKGELSLKAEVSSIFPQTLTFTPLSAEFAIAKKEEKEGWEHFPSCLLLNMFFTASLKYQVSCT